MGKSIAVMNTKGGVGKSTIVMALAETLSVHWQKNVLVIDSDSQTSISTMLMDMDRWEQSEREHRTIADYLEFSLLGDQPTDWKPFVATGVSDVDDANSVFLIPSHMRLSLFERMVSSQQKEGALREAVRTLLSDASRYFDVVLIDCPPGLSVLTECWLRECDYFMPPTKPDYLAWRGMSVLQKFRADTADQGFADLLGVIINMKDGRIGSEDYWHKRLLADDENRCFATPLPRRAYIQRAAEFDTSTRTYIAKYPGDAGSSIRAVTDEMLARLEGRPYVVPQEETAAAAQTPSRGDPAPARNARTAIVMRKVDAKPSTEQTASEDSAKPARGPVPDPVPGIVAPPAVRAAAASRAAADQATRAPEASADGLAPSPAEKVAVPATPAAPAKPAVPARPVENGAARTSGPQATATVRIRQVSPSANPAKPAFVAATRKAVDPARPAPHDDGDGAVQPDLSVPVVSAGFSARSMAPAAAPSVDEPADAGWPGASGHATIEDRFKFPPMDDDDGDDTAALTLEEDDDDGDVVELQPAPAGADRSRAAAVAPGDEEPLELQPVDLDPADLDPVDLEPVDLEPLDLETLESENRDMNSDVGRSPDRSTDARPKRLNGGA